MARSKRIFVELLAIAAAIIFGLTMAFIGPVTETSQPDSFDFGTIAQGTVIEFSARLVAPPEALISRLVRRAPRSWRGTLQKWLLPSATPQFRKTELLRPQITAPTFIHVNSVKADQRRQWYRGMPFVTAEFTLDTSGTGEFRGRIAAQFGKRRSFVPVRASVVTARSNGVRILVAATPYTESATQRGNDFIEATRVLGSCRSHAAGA